MECKGACTVAFGYLQVCFNRNIVECKVTRFYSCLTVGFRFNRNIVECKALKAKLTGMTKSGFNRNIVECKVSQVSLIPPLI